MNTNKLSRVEKFLVDSYVKKHNLHNALDVSSKFSKRVDFAVICNDTLYVAEATVSKTSSKMKSDGFDLAGAKQMFHNKYGIEAKRCVVAFLLPADVSVPKAVRVAFEDNNIPIETFELPSDLKAIVRKIKESASDEQRRKNDV